MKVGNRKLLSTTQYKAISLLLLKDINEMNYAEIAKELGVSDRTLFRWRNSSEFSTELIQQAETLQKAFLVETYAELRRLIASPDTADGNKLKAIEIMLKNQGRLKDVKESNVIVEDNRSLEDVLFEIKNV